MLCYILSIATHLPRVSKYSQQNRTVNEHQNVWAWIKLPIKGRMSRNCSHLEASAFCYIVACSSENLIPFTIAIALYFCAGRSFTVNLFCFVRLCICWFVFVCNCCIVFVCLVFLCFCLCLLLFLCALAFVCFSISQLLYLIVSFCIYVVAAFLQLTAPLLLLLLITSKVFLWEVDFKPLVKWITC